MEEAKKSFYKYCLVPMCQSSIRSTPDKVFFSVPRDAKIRKQWCKVMRRSKVSSKSNLYCCEDHFNIEKDTANYIQYNIMKQQGEKVTLKLKEGVAPHIFQCQNRNMPPPQERMYAIKRQRLSLINEALSEYADKSLERETSQSFCFVACDVSQTRPSMDICKTELTTSDVKVSSVTDKLHDDKSVQVNIKPKYRSKGIQVNLYIERKSGALSPCPRTSQYVGTSPSKSSMTTVVKKNYLLISLLMVHIFLLLLQ